MTLDLHSAKLIITTDGENRYPVEPVPFSFIFYF